MKSKNVCEQRPSRMENERSFEAWLEKKDGLGPYVVEKIWLEVGGKVIARCPLVGIIFEGDLRDPTMLGLRSFLTSLRINLASIGIEQGDHGPSLHDCTQPGNLRRHTEWVFSLEEERDRLPAIDKIVAKLHTIANALGYSKIDRMHVGHGFIFRVRTQKNGLRWISEGEYLLQRYQHSTSTSPKGA